MEENEFLYGHLNKEHGKRVIAYYVSVNEFLYGHLNLVRDIHYVADDVSVNEFLYGHLNMGTRFLLVLEKCFSERIPIWPLKL